MLWSEIQARGLSISRIEESSANHWLGQVRKDPSDNDRAWHQDDDPDPWALIGEKP